MNIIKKNKNEEGGPNSEGVKIQKRIFHPLNKNEIKSYEYKQ